MTKIAVSPIEKKTIKIIYHIWNKPHSSGFYCYELVATANALRSKASHKLPENILPRNHTDERDSVLNAIYFTAIDYVFNWGNFEPRTNVIVFVSANKWKWAEDDNEQRGPEYKLLSPDGQNNKEPCEQSPVPKKMLTDALDLKKNRIRLIGLLIPEIYSEYKNFFKDARFPENYHMLEISGFDGISAKGINNLIMPIIREAACTCKVRYEFALSIDSTQTFIEKFRRDNKSYLDESMPKIEFIVDKLIKEDPSTILHLTTFGDYPTVENHNANASYCYRYELSTSNKTEFLAAYTATEPNIKWSLNSNHTLKIIAIATGAFYKNYGNGGPEDKYPEAPSGAYSDCLHRPPYFGGIFKVLTNERFFVLPIIYGTAWSRWKAALHYPLDVFMQEEPPNAAQMLEFGNSIDFYANEKCRIK
ncbi:hypothetical protein Fcan01_25940 [Folsomia candida]|uniref:Uncharacterized protein n=1 Tax=Folsomia candida TaxID=158441 RepID=A0A226D3I5_FOLCA|nr:hypothetical protein Fcan01_25940 [Folsomia candida]